MDYTKIKAGPELDAIIAEKVMGYKILPPDNRRDFLRGTWFDDGVRQGPIPRYSTDIAAAWEVAEKADLFKNCRHLHQNGVVVREGGTWTRTGWEWVVEEVLQPIGQNTILARGETAELAICRAALEVAWELEAANEEHSD